MCVVQVCLWGHVVYVLCMGMCDVCGVDVGCVVSVCGVDVGCVVSVCGMCIHVCVLRVGAYSV
jgi:hypothetical protein